MIKHEHKPIRKTKWPARCRLCFKTIYPDREWYIWITEKAYQRKVKDYLDFVNSCKQLKGKND